jgi:carboxymethylenebutenolidase
MVLVGENLESGTIQYTSRDGTSINAFYSRPSGAGSYPGVIVTMGGDGLMEHYKDIARRFAGRGFLAVAPDLYTREGPPDPNNMDEVIKTLMSVSDSQAMDDLDGAAIHLKNQAHCNGKVGIIGFCSGGRYTLMMACQSSNIDAAVDSAGGNIV